MQEILYWLAANQLLNIGPVSIRRGLTHCKTIIELFSASHSTLQQIGFTPSQIQTLKKPPWKKAEQELAWCQQQNCQLLSLVDPAYPKLLREITDPPLVLYIRGNSHLLNRPQIALVGSRNPTATGKELAEKFAAELARAGLVITSGLALGIDAASHRGALQTKGGTIAVLGTGLQHIYPTAHHQLAADIAQQGTIVSEFPIAALPKAAHFPRRNRIISGLSLGVLVVEAALQSGSLITARYALEQNREVFAIPSSIHNPLARGCHQLIQQGAKLVETTQDILTELNIPIAPPKNTPPQQMIDLDPSLQRVLAQIGYEVTAMDVIILRSGLTATEVSSMLLSLELQEYINVVPGGYIRRVNSKNK